MTEESVKSANPAHVVVMPSRVWRKMTPQEYAEQYKGFGCHVAVSQELIEGARNSGCFWVEVYGLNWRRIIKEIRNVA